MKSLIESLIEKYEDNAYWEGSVFEPVTKMSTDYKGKFGEELLFNFIKDFLSEIPVEWDGDSNTDKDDGIYDLYWKQDDGSKKRVEVKTSGRTVSNGKPCGWQHENIYYSDNVWDNLAFLDYDSNDIMYVTVVSYDQIVEDNRIDLSLFGKNGHTRKNVVYKAKVDFSRKSIRNGITNGVTFTYDVNNPDNKGLAKFLKEKLV